MATEYAADYGAAEEKLNPIIAGLTAQNAEFSNEITNLQKLVEKNNTK